MTIWRESQYKLKWGSWGGPLPNRTSALTGRRVLDTQRNTRDMRSQRTDDVQTRGEQGHLQAQERDPRRNQPHWPLALRLLSLQDLDKISLIALLPLCVLAFCPGDRHLRRVNLKRGKVYLGSWLQRVQSSQPAPLPWAWRDTVHHGGSAGWRSCSQLEAAKQKRK